MAVTEEIAWGDGSGDKIYLTADALEGNQQVLVSSDANAGVARTKTVIFTATGVTPVVLTVNQAAGIAPVFYDLLVFDGTAYIDTDIVPGANDSFLCLFGNETKKATQRMFQFACANSARTGVVQNSSTNSTRRYFSQYYGSTSSLSSVKYLNYSTTTFNLFLTPKRFGWNNSANTQTKGSNTPTGGLVIGSSVDHSGQPYTGSIGTFYIYGSDAQNVSTSSGFSSYTPTHTLRPCTYNGVAGLWCVETNKFYGNSASSGSLSVSNL